MPIKNKLGYPSAAGLATRVAAMEALTVTLKIVRTGRAEDGQSTTDKRSERVRRSTQKRTTYFEQIEIKWQECAAKFAEFGTTDEWGPNLTLRSTLSKPTEAQPRLHSALRFVQNNWTLHVSLVYLSCVRDRKFNASPSTWLVASTSFAARCRRLGPPTHCSRPTETSSSVAQRQPSPRKRLHYDGIFAPNRSHASPFTQNP